jgi:MerR family transcriptional regulator, heat shock protein HspR
MAKRRRDGFVMISIISERYNIHPQTLRLYEREGLLMPARTGGNTRLYGPDQIRRLETILTLTRDLGVNLAGVEVFLNLQKELEKIEMNCDMLLVYIRQVMIDKRIGVNRDGALVRVTTQQLQKVR